MLKLLRRKKVAKRIFYCLAAIIIPAFVIWGSASTFNKNKTPNYAGIMFGKKVSFDEFGNALHAWQTQLKLQYGEKAKEVAAAFMDANQAAWDRLILLHEVKSRRIKIKDEEIVNMLTQMPFLQRDGRFDPQSYKLFLQYSLGVQPRVFEEELRQNLAMAEVFKQTTQNVSLSENEIKKEYENNNVQTKIQYVFFPAQGYKDKISVSDEDLNSYYEKTKEKFRVPPQINVSYIGIELKEGESNDAKAEAAEKLKRAYAEAKKKDLNEAASKLDLKIQETGFFGFNDPIPALGWMPKLSSLLFDIPAHNLSKIVELNRGIYIFYIKEKKDAYLPDFKQAKERVREALLNERSKETALQKAKDFLSEIKNKNLAFQKAAEEAGLAVKETPLFSREAYIPELGMAEPLKSVAFGLTKDTIANNVVELEQGFYVVKSLVSPIFDEEKFRKEKEEFSKQLLEQKRAKVFNDFFEDLKKRANLVSFMPESKAR